MNIVDSCGWLEYFADGKNAHIFAPIIENTTELLVPVISIYEVFKRVLQQRDESAALQAIALMQQGQIIPLSVETSLFAFGQCQQRMRVVCKYTIDALNTECYC